MDIPNKTLASINNKTARVGVIGLGYVGLPLLLRFYEAGFSVVGFDNNKVNVTKLKKGQSTIKHIKNSNIEKIIKDKNSVITDDLSLSSTCDALIICLPTPLDENNTPDLSYITKLLDSIKLFLRQGQLISLESTTYPGTTEEVILPYLEKSNLKVGSDLFLCYSPEREDPGNKDFSTQSIPKLCAGYSESCSQLAKALYESVINEVVMVSSLKVAEMSKLLENIYRAVNVGLINEMRIVATALDIDIYEVIEAASSKPFGFTAYYPGPGLGGHCLPIDPIYLSWKASQVGVESKFIELAAEVNRSVPKQVVSCLEDNLFKLGKELKGLSVLVAGLAYKKNIDDARESPSYDIISLLHSKGANVDYSDPYIKSFPETRKYKFNLSHVEINKENLGNYDAVILATDHDDFDLAMMQDYCKLLLDTRGVCDKALKNVIRI